MVLSVSDAVVEILETMHFLKPAMRIDVVNHSALARFIKPAVEKRIGGEVELETIIMAIRRNAHVFTGERSELALDVLKDCKIDLVTGMGFIKFKYLQEASNQILDFVKHMNAEQMQNVYTTQRIDEITAVLPEALIPKIEKIPAAKKDPFLVKEKRGELAIITIRLPSVSVEVPGVFAAIVDALADNGISLLTTLGSFMNGAIVVDEKDAPLAYEKINTLIRESREIVEMRDKKIKAEIAKEKAETQKTKAKTKNK